jgi:hypothetical protein
LSSAKAPAARPPGCDHPERRAPYNGRSENTSGARGVSQRPGERPRGSPACQGIRPPACRIGVRACQRIGVVRVTDRAPRVPADQGPAGAADQAFAASRARSAAITPSVCEATSAGLDENADGSTCSCASFGRSSRNRLGVRAIVLPRLVRVSDRVT